MIPLQNRTIFTVVGRREKKKQINYLRMRNENVDRRSEIAIRVFYNEAVKSNLKEGSWMEVYVQKLCSGLSST